MKLLFADPRRVQAFFLAACGRAAGIAFESLRRLSGDLPSVGPEGAPDGSTCSGKVRCRAAQLSG